MGQGNIEPIAAPDLAPNATYVLAFDGPQLSCTEVSGDLFDRIASNIDKTNASMNATFGPTTPQTAMSYGFIAWTPDEDDSRPFQFSNSSDYTLRGGSVGPLPMEEDNVTTPATLFVAALPSMIDVGAGAEWDGYNATAGGTILQCQLSVPVKGFRAPNPWHT